MQQVRTKSINRNMVLSAIKSLMSIVFSLISFPYITKIFGVDNIGQYNFANSIVSYFILLAGLGINTYAIREGARVRENEIKFKKFVNEMFSINLISTVVSYFLLAVLILFVAKFRGYMSLLIILSLQIIFKTIGIEWIYSIYEDYAYITVQSIVFQIFSLVLLLLFVKTEKDVNIYAAITVIASVGSNVLNFVHAHCYCKVRWTFNINWKKHIKPILLLFAMSVTVTIYVSSDMTIIGFLCGDRTLGIYSVSSKIYSVIKTVLSSVLIVSIPRMSAMLGKKDMNGFNLVANNIYNTLITVVTPVIIGIIILRKQIICFISDVDYISAASSLTLLSIALFFCLGAWFWGQCILVPLKLENIVIKITVLSALLNIGLNFVLIPVWQENAAALTTVFAEALSFVWCMYEGKKHLNIKGTRVVFIKVIVGCIGIICIAHVLQSICNSVILYTFSTIFLSVLAYLIIEILLKNPTICSATNSLVIKIKK